MKLLLGGFVAVAVFLLFMLLRMMDNPTPIAPGVIRASTEAHGAQSVPQVAAPITTEEVRGLVGREPLPIPVVPDAHVIRIQELERTIAAKDLMIQDLQDRLAKIELERILYLTERSKNAQAAFRQTLFADQVLRACDEEGLEAVLDLVGWIGDVPSGVNFVESAKNEVRARRALNEWQVRFNETQLKAGGNLDDPSMKPLLFEKRRILGELEDGRQIVLGVWADKLPK